MLMIYYSRHIFRSQYYLAKLTARLVATDNEHLFYRSVYNEIG